MSSKIVFISDDTDFFEYMVSKIKLRKSDEVFRFNFDNFIKNYHLLTNSLVIINSDKSKNKTLNLLKLISDNPCIVFGLNEDESYKNMILKEGALEYFTPYSQDQELSFRISNALKIASILEKKAYYRELLVKNNTISKNNEVLCDYKSILEQELVKISEKSIPTVLVAISPNEKTKFLLQPNQIETCILNNIRKTDILLNYAANKYFLLLFNTDISSAQKIWANIKKQIPEKIYAGFANALYKKREQIINEVLNNLHQSINHDKDIFDNNNTNIINNNFKNYKQNFEKNLKKIITPVFFQIQQNYNNKLFGMRIEQTSNENNYNLCIKSKHSTANFKITSAGFTKINIDISIENLQKEINSKRISFNPEEFESGILEDLLEQFILEFKKECGNDYT